MAGLAGVGGGSSAPIERLYPVYASRARSFCANPLTRPARGSGWLPRALGGSGSGGSGSGWWWARGSGLCFFRGGGGAGLGGGSDFPSFLHPPWLGGSGARARGLGGGLGARARGARGSPFRPLPQTPPRLTRSPPTSYQQSTWGVEISIDFRNPLD